MALLSPSKKTKKLTPWYAFLILAVIAVAFGLKITDALRPDRVPTSDVPAVSYNDIVNENDEVADPSPEVNDPDPGPVIEPDPVPTPEPETPDPSTPISGRLNLAVPFTSQAPTGNWDPLHDDACEEASFFMAMEFYAGRSAGGQVDPSVVDPELYKMVDLQTSLGMGYSISAAEAVTFIAQYYGATAVIVDNPSVDDIKALIAAGKPVILPAAGRELGNPNFTGAGPLYHMLVIRGYTEDTFITNDPGTRNGENYVYSTDVIMDAMADWNNGDPTNGAKRILYIEP